MKFYIATDHAGYPLKEFVINYIKSKKYEIIDLGPFNENRVDYPDFAQKCANTVVKDIGSFGILICGTGIGVSISANKIIGIRAALCHNSLTATLSRKHNNSNILCFGARILNQEEIKKIINSFCSSKFEEGRHKIRVDKIEK